MPAYFRFLTILAFHVFLQEKVCNYLFSYYNIEHVMEPTCIQLKHLIVIVFNTLLSSMSKFNKLFQRS